jgi:hypothetical protein
VSNPRDRHEPARKAAKAIRTAEKHRIENLAVEIGSELLRDGTVDQAIVALEVLNIRYTKILVQERLDREATS